MRATAYSPGASSVTIALNTGLRYSEILLLRWSQIELKGRQLTVGDSKTAAGRGRSVPLNERATAVVSFWAELFPDRKPEHYVFAAEGYGLAGDGRTCHAFAKDPTRPIRSLKVSWRTAKTVAGVTCRFHDLRHTAVTRLVESGLVSLPVVASIMGWSTATTVRMAKRYGRIGQIARRQAMAVLDGGTFGPAGAQNGAQAGAPQVQDRAN